MNDEMSKDLAAATAAENAAISAFGQLEAAKTKEINALTAALETKMQRTGELAVVKCIHWGPFFGISAVIVLLKSMSILIECLL